MWHASAFGLHISGSFPAPGLEELEEPGGQQRRRPTVLRIGSDKEIDRLAAGATGDRTLIDRSLAGTRMRITQEARGAYLILNEHYGCFRVSADGGEVICVPHELPAWYWQRFLVGQVLPLAALRHGLEPLHASAVELGGRALLCLGTSGAGKTCTALHLVARGAGFLADDVVAAEVGSEGVLAHPGAALASVDPGELERLATRSELGSWTRLGMMQGEVRLRARRAGPDAVVTNGLYVLVRDDDARELTVQPLPGNPVASLLGATFNAYVDDPQRLLVQLDVCTGLSEAAATRHVMVPRHAGPSEVADAILADAAALRR